MRRDAGVEDLMRELSRSLWAGESAEHLVGDLVRLARTSEPGSPAWQFALGNLAAAVGPTDPWRASLIARELLAFSKRDHGAWAVLGLSQSLLGNLRYAARCYERALLLSPDEPRYAHNLGHLYDVAFDRPADAVPLLERAHRAEPRCPHVASSLAHALGRAGRAEDGLKLLREALRAGATRDQAEVLAWLEKESRRPSIPPSPTVDDAGLGMPKRRRRRSSARR